MKLVLFVIVLLFSSAVAQTFTQYPIPSRTIAGNVCTSPDGLYVYFTLNTTIGRIDMTGRTAEFRVPAVGANAMSLVGCSFSPAGTLYFADQNSYTIYAFDPASRAFKKFTMADPHSEMAGLVFHTDGLLYILVSGSSAIQRMAPDGTFVPPVLLPPGRYPHGPSSCAGNVWFAENAANRLAIITPTGIVQEFLLPTSNTKPFSTVCATDGGVYFTLNAANKIGRVDTTTYDIVTWSIPTPNSKPKGISLSKYGICFAESNVNKIGCKSLLSNAITETNVSVAGAAPNKLVSGPDGAVWFSESNVSYLARFR